MRTPCEERLQKRRSHSLRFMLSLSGHIFPSMSFLDCNASHSDVPYMLDIPDWHALLPVPSSLPYFIAVPISDLIVDLQCTPENNHHILRPNSFKRHPSSVAVAMAMRSRWDLGSDASLLLSLISGILVDIFQRNCMQRYCQEVAI
ncbi:hypothetical protein LXL04_014351 [Taraxacum kok-saghyz]